MGGIGFVAIVASLAFVGIETRNSTGQATLTAQALEMTASPKPASDHCRIQVISGLFVLSATAVFY